MVLQATPCVILASVQYANKDPDLRVFNMLAMHSEKLQVSGTAIT